MNVSPSVISDYEGGRRIPGLGVVRKLVNGLLALDLDRGGKVIARLTRADELYAAYRKEGESIKKREDTHRMAESNRAFAHLAY